MVLALIVAGLINGGLVGAILMLRGVGERNRAALLLGGAILLAAAVAGLILSTMQMPRQEAPVSQAAEILLTLLAGPLVVAATCHLVGRRTPWLPLALLFTGACLFIGAAAARGADPILLAVPVQIGFTLWAWLAYMRGRPAARDDRRTRAYRKSRAALSLLLIATLIHVAQVLRMLMPDNEILRPAVPFTVGAIFLLLTLFAAVRLLTPRSIAPLAPARAGAHSDVLVNRLANWLEQDGRLADPDLRLNDAAAGLGHAPADVSRAVTAAGHSGFAAFVQRLRIEHAKRQLADPAERRTSIDAIGLSCGFRSRSAFYEAFRRETGMTPGAYRSRKTDRNLS